MYIRVLNTAVAVLLISSAATADTTATGESSEVTEAENSSTNVISSNSGDVLDATRHTPPNAEPESDSTSGSPSITSTKTETQNSSTTSSTNTHSSSGSSIESIDSQPSSPTTRPNDVEDSTSSSLPTASAEPPPTNESPSRETSRTSVPETSSSRETSTLPPIPNTGEDDRSAADESTTTSRPSVISKTPVVSPELDTFAAATTQEVNQQSLSTTGSAEASQNPPDEHTSTNLFEHSSDYGTSTSEETYVAPQNDTLTSIATREDTEATSTDVTESPSNGTMPTTLCTTQQDPAKTIRNYHIVTVTLVLVMNLAFCVVTVFCVHRITKHHETRSWDPPPIRYDTNEQGARSFPRNPRWHSHEAPSSP